MRTYEPRWSAEEQTMIDLMELSGLRVNADINSEYTDIFLQYQDGEENKFRFRADTPYEAIRKAFNTWSKRNEN